MASAESATKAGLVRAPETIGLRDGGTGLTSAVLDVLRSLPPEAIVNVVDIIGEVLRARAAFSQRQAEFLGELEMLRSKSGDRERTMSLVSELLLNAELNDDAKLKLVDTICQLALR